MLLDNLYENIMTSLPVGRQPHISIDNRKFAASYGDKRVSIAEWDQERGESYMEIVVIGKSRGIFKIMYSESFDPANPAAPICWSANSQGPASQVRAPQAPYCNVCPWDRWGSSVSAESGKSVKRCTDKQRLVVLSPKLNFAPPLQFDVPPAAFKSFGAAIKMIADAGHAKMIHNVIIRVYFVPNDQGVLSFTPYDYVDKAHGSETLHHIVQMAQQSSVLELAGYNEVPFDPSKWTPEMAQQVQEFVTPPPAQNQLPPASHGQPALQRRAEPMRIEHQQEPAHGRADFMDSGRAGPMGAYGAGGEVYPPEGAAAPRGGFTGEGGRSERPMAGAGGGSGQFGNRTDGRGAAGGGSFGRVDGGGANYAPETGTGRFTGAGGAFGDDGRSTGTGGGGAGGGFASGAAGAGGGGFAANQQIEDVDAPEAPAAETKSKRGRPRKEAGSGSQNTAGNMGGHGMDSGSAPTAALRNQLNSAINMKIPE